MSAGGGVELSGLDPAEVVTITSTTGVRFNVRLLREGDAYGATFSLFWLHQGRPGVEFYDTRYPHTPFGQFTGGRYFVADIIEGTGGLDLATDIPAWKIDAAAMAVVRTWLRHETQREW